MSQPSHQHAIIIGELCPYCQKHRSPLDIIQMPGGAKICVQCEQRHLEALEAMASGVFTGRCSECDLDHLELKAQKRCGPQGQMAVHFENGKYRILCIPCDKLYVPKRRELYKGTEFAHQAKLD